MFKKLLGRSKAIIGNNSSNNSIIQNSVVNSPIICNGYSDTLAMLCQAGQYDAIQEFTNGIIEATKKTHPLYPTFSATRDEKLGKLVSTPETEDAFKQYPKTAKGTFIRNTEKYPHMGKEEMPWEYAYRTQTMVEMQATAYQEYLGDIEDPFPAFRYSDGMKIFIGAPEFPPAVEATISAGEISIPFQLRRKPWLEYNEICFGSVSGECGLDIKIIANKALEKIRVTFAKTPNVSLEIQLLREQLFVAIKKTRQFSMTIEGSRLITYPIPDDDLNKGLLHSPERMVQYYECLLNIEKNLHCHFDTSIMEISWDEYKAALIISDSLEEKWHRFRGNFENEIRCDYDNIPDDLSDINYETSGLAIMSQVGDINVHGVTFTADRYVTLYQGAKLNNLESVMKNKKKRKKDILMTFRPENGNDYFFKYCRFEGIRLADSDQ